MLNLMENPIVKTISAADKSIDETILSAVRDMNETRSSAEADIAELQAAQAELETALTAIDTQLSGEKQIWLFPLFLICLAIPWVKEKYDQLAGLITQHKNLKNQISDDELRRKHQTLMDALDRKRQALIDALNQKFQALAALGIEFQSQAENNCKFDEKFLKSKDKKILSFISAGEWKLTSREENIEGITLPALPHCVFPQIIMFPFDKPFYGKLYETDAAVRLLLLRLLFALPVGAVELTVIDPLNLGRSFLEFMPLRSIEGLVQDNCCLTRSKDIESALSDLCNYLESLMQEKQIAKWVGKDKNKNPVDKNENPVKDYDKNENPLQDKAGREISPFAPYANYLANWPVYDLSDIKKPVSIEYKARKEISLLPYKLVLIYGFPEQFSDSSITYLKRILEIGPLLGVLPIVLLDYYCHDLLSRLRSNWKSYTDSLSNAELEKATDHLRRYWKTMEEVRQHKSADILMAIYNGVISNITGDFPETLRRLECKVVPEPEPQPEKFDEYVHWISNAYKERLKIEKVIKEQVWGIIKPSDAWKQNSSLNGISALVGWNVEKEEVEIRFVDAVSHAFIGGVSGAGKSNLLHDIIHNLIHKYSAEELNIYLLDYKGTEFQCYTGIDPETNRREFSIPQIKLVTQMMSREDGVMILDHIVNENNKRVAEFNKAKVASISKYRKKTGEKMPRIVVIIDEFHTMFEEDDNFAKKSSLGLEKLLRKGRSQGIHVLLATQSLQGIRTIMAKYKEQLTCRIALRCGEEDSPLILNNSNNKEASKLPVRTGNQPREGILNESGGILDNKRFSIPYINHDIDDDGKLGNGGLHLRTIADNAQQQVQAADMKVINGEELPLLTEEVFSKTVLMPPEIILGQELNYTAEPFKFKWDRSNLCIAVPAEHESLPVRQAILRSLLACVQQHKMFDNDSIVYYKADENSRFDISDIPGIQFQDHKWDGNISGLAADFSTKRSLLIVDTLEAAEMFHPPKQTSGTKKDEAAVPTPAELLKKLLEEGPKNGSFVIAFVESWKRFNEIYKSYLDLFGFRIGYGLREKDAGGLVDDSMSPSIKDKGFDNGTKAVFADIKRGKTHLFRPFVVR